MNFKERRKPTTKVQLLQELAPVIGIEANALTKMGIYVDECDDEIGWLGTAYKNEENNTIVIKDVYLFDQDVHGATTEITPEGLTEFATELISMGDAGIEIWNNLKMWGHSHVRMGVSPSGQDDSQMATFREGGHDWFLRLIANKHGEIKIDLYDYTTGVIYLDLAWVEIPSEQEKSIQDQIDDLYKLLDTYVEQRTNTFKEPIKEEMKEKVRRMASTTTTSVTKWGEYIGGRWYTKAELNRMTAKEIAELKQEAELKKKVTPINQKSTGKKNTTATGSTTTGTLSIEEEDYFDTDDDVVDEFGDVGLDYLSACESLEELSNEIAQWGYEDLNMNDLERVFRVAKKVQFRR